MLCFSVSIFSLEATILFKKCFDHCGRVFRPPTVRYNTYGMPVDASSTHVVLIEVAREYQHFLKTTRYTLSRRRSNGKSASPLSWLTWSQD